MTSRNGSAPAVPPGTPLVRAPRAVQMSDDEAWPGLAQGALGLGAPALSRNGDIGPPASEGALAEVTPVMSFDRVAGAPDVSAQDAPPQPTSSHSMASPPGTPQASLPTSPADHDGMYRGLLWVAWAIEECSRAFTRLSSRLAMAERRLDQLEAGEELDGAAQPSPAHSDDGRLERLEARVDQSQADASARIAGLEERLRQIDFIPLKVSNLQRSIDQLEAAQRRASVVKLDRPEPPSAVDPKVRVLRRELTAAQSQLAALEARAGEERMAAMVDEAVRRHVHRLATQTPAATDLEGVYRELDSVAEFVAARSAAAAETLERVAPLESAVLELRRDLLRVVGDLGVSVGTGPSEVRLEELENRLRKLELSGTKASRLFSALAGVVPVREPEDAQVPHADNAYSVAAPNGAYGPPHDR